jgi:hypothetical protein
MECTALMRVLYLHHYSLQAVQALQTQVNTLNEQRKCTERARPHSSLKAFAASITLQIRFNSTFSSLVISYTQFAPTTHSIYTHQHSIYTQLTPIIPSTPSTLLHLHSRADGNDNCGADKYNALWDYSTPDSQFHPAPGLQQQKAEEVRMGEWVIIGRALGKGEFKNCGCTLRAT